MLLPQTMTLSEQRSNKRSLLCLLPFMLLNSRSFAFRYLLHRRKTPSVSKLQRLIHHSSPLKMASDGSSSAAAYGIVQQQLMHCPTIPLRNGMHHPGIGFGTYKVGYLPPSASAAAAATVTDTKEERTAVECVTDALERGYRFFECAEFYGNEHAVGEAIANAVDAGVIQSASQDLFLCSKVWTTTIEQGPAAIRAQLTKTLSDLGTDSIDLYLIHWPVPGHHVQAYKTLIQLRDEGLIKGIGVSNYAWEDYLELKDDPDIKESDLPCVNQIEVNPFLYRANTISKFQADGVVLQSYRSLRDGKAMTDPTLVRLAESYQRSPAQILGRWCVQHGFVYIPKTVQSSRMLENAAVFDFELSTEDMTSLDKLTTQSNIDTFVALYRKCVNRDTSKDGTMDGVKLEITAD